ncbi:MAG: hypothetical protein KGL64_07655 [Acidobacteriota bacterium]|nr:hypothetical protein [Acidobacteriota bacterium]
MRLTRSLILLSMFAACCTTLLPAAQQPVITIDSKTQAVKLGQPIYIHIVLKNTTDRQFTVVRSVGGARGEQNYRISVIDTHGGPAARTKYGEAREKHPEVNGSRSTKTLAPGQDVDEYVELTQMFDMSEPGTYILQVSRLSPFDRAVILKSNILAIKVDNE